MDAANPIFAGLRPACGVAYGTRHSAARQGDDGSLLSPATQCRPSTTRGQTPVTSTGRPPPWSSQALAASAPPSLPEASPNSAPITMEMITIRSAFAKLADISFSFVMVSAVWSR